MGLRPSLKPSPFFSNASKPPAAIVSDVWPNAEAPRYDFGGLLSAGRLPHFITRASSFTLNFTSLPSATSPPMSARASIVSM